MPNPERQSRARSEEEPDADILAAPLFETTLPPYVPQPLDTSSNPWAGEAGYDTYDETVSTEDNPESSTEPA